MRWHSLQVAVDVLQQARGLLEGRDVVGLWTGCTGRTYSTGHLHETLLFVQNKQIQKHVFSKRL